MGAQPAARVSLGAFPGAGASYSCGSCVWLPSAACSLRLSCIPGISLFCPLFPPEPQVRCGSATSDSGCIAFTAFIPLCPYHRPSSAMWCWLWATSGSTASSAESSSAAHPPSRCARCSLGAAWHLWHRTATCMALHGTARPALIDGSRLQWPLHSRFLQWLPTMLCTSSDFEVQCSLIMPLASRFLPRPNGHPACPAASRLPPASQVLKLPRSGGVVVRSRELRQAARKVRVEEYFYGNRKVSFVGWVSFVVCCWVCILLSPWRGWRSISMATGRWDSCCWRFACCECWGGGTCGGMGWKFTLDGKPCSAEEVGAVSLCSARTCGILAETLCRTEIHFIPRRSSAPPARRLGLRTCRSIEWAVALGRPPPRSPLVSAWYMHERGAWALCGSGQSRLTCAS